MQELLLEGPDITVYDLASNREFSEASIVNVILPFVATFFFIFATMSAAGPMLGVVAGEKENRTIEVMVTSVTPGQLIGGKAVGLLAASLTQLAIYIVAAVIGLIVAAQYVPELQQVEVPWVYLGIMVLFFLPTFALISAVMIAIGSAVTELQQGQQLAGLLNLVFMVPLFLLPMLMQNPGGPLMVFLTLFPTTSLHDNLTAMGPGHGAHVANWCGLGAADGNHDLCGLGSSACFPGGYAALWAATQLQVGGGGYQGKWLAGVVPGECSVLVFSSRGKTDAKHLVSHKTRYRSDVEATLLLALYLFRTCSAPCLERLQHH